MALTLLRFARRNVLRNARRSALTVAAMAGGLFVLVFLKGLQDGYVAQRLDAGLGLSLGHIVVRSADRSGILDGTGVAKALASEPGVIAAAPRVRFEAFAQSAAAAAGISVLGVDPAAEASATWLPRAVVAGNFLKPDDLQEPYPMLLGKELARRLDVGLGDKIALLVEGEDRALVAEPFRLVGIFHSGATLFDSGVAYVPRPVAARMVLVRGDATEVIARVNDALAAPEIAARAARTPKLGGLAVDSWREAAPEVLEAMEVLRVMEVIRTTILFALVGLGIFNTVTMALYERRREFGMLMAVGMSPGAIFQLLVLEIALLSLSGVVLGVGSGMAVVTGWLGKTGVSVSALGARLPGALAGTSVIYPIVRLENLFIAGAWVLGISVAVLIVPLYRILRLDPATVLRDRP
ncbi:MAG TPA: ABC transporter permease [Candidatus Binatia bacterium]|jgi:ABC-type lipoprotein release transport system permease subunit